jgi:hypothetical protein
MTAPLRILLLADDQKGHPDTIHDHIRMFPCHSRHEVRVFNPRGLARSRFLDFDAFDVVVLHYSIVVIWDAYLAPTFRDQIRRFQGLTVQFLQDEYRYVDAITAAMRELGVDVLYSVVPPEKVSSVYGDRLPGTEILPTLTGYVPDRLVGHAAPPLAGRPVDVGYRGRSLPFWLGRLGFEKIEIGRGFAARAGELGLRTDIAWTEGARIYGDRWHAFVTSCRTMLASESGSSIVDYDGSVERAVRAYLAASPAADYEEIEREVLARFAGAPEINTLSPRLFEAAALRTGMVMFPGGYSGAVRAGEHYLPLEKDFSNIAEIAEQIRDTPLLEQLTEAAYEELIASGRYSERGFVARFDDEVAERAGPRRAVGRYPAALLRLEQAAAGRGYHVSTLYGVAREAILAYLGAKNALRSPALRRLLVRAPRRGAAGAATSLWDDLFRLAILTSVQRGRQVLAGDPFHVVGRYDAAEGRLTLTSRPGNGPRATDDEGVRAVAEAARAHRLREIVWNHASLEQYVPLRFGPTGVRIAFDVGRYDAYGVYRFDALATLARERPEDVVAALAPLVASPQPTGANDPDSETKRGPRP